MVVSHIQMDQRGLAHHGFLPHEHQSLHEQHFGATRPPKKISLRSLSKSDPHLNVPHLLLAQDDAHPSLNKIVSGLFHADTVLNSVHHLSAEGSMAHVSSNNSPHLRPSESSSNLLRDAHSLPSPTLRKSTSAINWSSVVANDTNKAIWDSNWSAADQQHLKEHTTDYLQGLAFTRNNDHSEGGLVMSSSSDNKMSVIAPAIPAQNPFSQALAGSSTSAQLSSSSSNPLEPHHAEAHDRKGVFGNMFRQGFFSRPVVRSEEEQYRYLMALDR